MRRALAGAPSRAPLADPRWPIALALAAAAVVFLRSGFPSNLAHSGPDDAFITYRYAENLAAGHGWVFNPGDPPVLGTSTPLYTLILAAAAKLGADLPRFSIALGTLATALTAAGLVLLGWRLGWLWAGCAAALAWAASPFTYAFLEGMETPLYLALVVGAIGAEAEERSGLALSLAALAVLARLDGAAVLVVVAGRQVLAGRWSWRAAWPALALIGAWLAFATWRFGSPIPASGLAKIAHDPAISGRFGLGSWHFLFSVAPAAALMRSNLGWLGPALALLAALAAVTVGRGACGAALLAAWLVLYVAGFSLLRLPDFTWYYGPPALATSLLLWIALERALAAWKPGARAAVLAPAIALALAPWAASIPARADVLPAQWEAGRWLRTHARPDATVAAYEVGMVGYASGLRVIDLLGLTEPRARPYLERRDYAWAIRELRPTYVLTNQPSDWPVTAALFAEPALRERYRPVASFPFRADTDYLLLERVE